MKIRISKVARYFDESNKQGEDEFEFIMANGRIGKKRLLAAHAASRAQLLAFLQNANARLPAPGKDLKDLLQELVLQTPGKHFTLAKRAGWRRKRTTFVRANYALGNDQEHILGVSPSRHSSGFKLPKRKGTAKNWRMTVAPLLAESSAALLLASSAFAAPLLSYTRQPSFGFCISAPSRSGKTAISIAAASIIGNGSEAALLKWNSTEKALEQSFALSNDCCVFIDDSNAKKGSPSAVYEAFKSIAHLIASGYGTARHRSWDISTGSGHDNWRTIAITSRENSLHNLAASLNKQREDGEAVRLIDVPALPLADMSIFDRLENPDIGPAQLSLKLAKLRNSSEKSQGVVFDEYVESIMNDPDVKKKIRKFRASFKRKALKISQTAIALDLAEKFATIYTGGALATDYGLTGWNRVELRDALLLLYSKAISVFPDPKQALRSGLDRLVIKLRALPRRNTIDKQTFKNITGYRWKPRGSKFLYARITPEEYATAFLSKEQADMVTDLLLSRNIMKRRLRKKITAKADPKEQHTWPDKQRRRSYQFRIEEDLVVDLLLEKPGAK